MPGQKKTNPQARMRVTEHLLELRKRLLLALAGIFVAAIGGWFLVTPTLNWMQEPLRKVSGQAPQLNFQTIGAAFDMRIQVSLWLGVLISAPWWIFQIGAFIAPGLKRKEKIYITFFMRLVLAFGLSCLAPEILVVLNFAGVMKAKTMLKGWRWAVVLAAVFSAVANPLPTAWPMIVQMAALIGLYLLAVGISAINDWIKAGGSLRPRFGKNRRKRKHSEASSASEQ
ncbi:MAG: twin-arginine translocase subunit TatC [Varibaculum cambriense]|nr:twin-arginine translocase subunit TatC [Varibaculum cambriense]